MNFPRNLAFVLMLISVLLQAGMLHAQDDPRIQAARQLTEVTYDPDATYKGFIYVATISFVGQLNKIPELAAHKQELVKTFQDVSKQAFYDPKIQDLFKKTNAQIYAQEFTAKELKELTEFYKTETGRKTLQKLPIIFDKWEQNAGHIAKQIMSPKYTKILDERIAELLKDVDIR